MEVTDEALTAMFAVLSAHLDERQRRLLAGAQARALGRGGIAAAGRASGRSRSTVRIGTTEIDQGPQVTGRVRRPGAGRPKAADRDPGLLAALDGLVEPTARGGPESPLRCTCTSTPNLAHELTAQGHPVSARTVAELLVDMDYSLPATSKQTEGAQHPDRDDQFRYVNEQAREQLAAGQPVISVDTKKKEVVGTWPTRAANGSLRATRCGWTCTTSPTPRSARRSPMGSTTWAQAPAGSAWATTTTPPRSRWQPSAAGGSKSARWPTRRRPGCLSPPS